MADNVVEVSTNEDLIFAVATRIHQNERQILESLSPSELLPYLCACGLVELQEEEGLFDESITRKNRTKCLLAVLSPKGSAAYLRFLECLEKETSHLGHAYIASLLRGAEFGKKEEVGVSSRLKERIIQSMPDLVKGLDVLALAPYLKQDNLLTDSEYELLITSRTQNIRATNLLQILGTKGPTAHYIFTCCLEEEREHRTHWELFQKIVTEEDCTGFRLCSKQRKRIADNVVAVTKRVPDRLKAHGTLVSKEYFGCMKKIRRYHLMGEWDRADEIVKECMLKDDKVLQIAVILENCTGFITRREKDTVLKYVEEARELCRSELLESDNWAFLWGRCEWVLAKLYRYTADTDKALQCIRKATEVQFNIESGEDAALTNYCHACILLELLAVRNSIEDSRKAKAALEFAIHYASNEEYGLDLSHPQIRLAQLYLGSSPSQPGRDASSLSEAESSLQAVEEKFATLAPRTQCIFYFTKSDLLYNSGETDEAKHLAQLSLDIATENNFKTEIISAQARLNSL